MPLQERPASSRRLTSRYPELGDGPVNYDDAIDPEFFADEQEAVFRRWWLYVGRAEQLPRPGRPGPGLVRLQVKATGICGSDLHSYADGRIGDTTVTSPLIPWNSCGAYMSAALGVSTFVYFPYCFFNFLNPVLGLVYGFVGINVQHLTEQDQIVAETMTDVPLVDQRK